MSGLKNVSTQKSMFDSPKENRKEAFDESIAKAEAKAASYKERAAKLSSDLNKMMQDKTLHTNKTPFQKSFESDIVAELVKLALDVNSDENEPEGAGSVSCIILLLNTCLLQRDKINKLEYDVSLLKKQSS